MPSFRRFAKRLHGIQKTVQRQEEATLARLTGEQEDLARQRAMVHETKLRASESRNLQHSALELVEWQQYVYALETLEVRLAEGIEEANQRVDEQRDKLRIAFQDTRRWETTVDRLETRERLKALSKMEKDADEMAVQRMRGNG